MTPPSPEVLSLAGIGLVSLFGCVKLLYAHRAGGLRRRPSRGAAS